MHALYESGADLVLRVRDGDSAALTELFAVRVARWPHPMMHDECFTVGLFGDLTSSLEPATAFALIAKATSLVFAQRDPASIACALELLIDLARASDTTEMPLELQRSWSSLYDHVGGGDGWDALRQWYRRSGA